MTNRMGTNFTQGRHHHDGVQRQIDDDEGDGDPDGLLESLQEHGAE